MPIATACANIALVKYWGKRDTALNLPARGSLSLTLRALQTITSVELLDAAEDALLLGGEPQQGRPLARIAKFLDLVRARAKPELAKKHAMVVSKSAFPIAAGLASSASGFAALAVAASEAYGLGLSRTELSALARQGSGSAARSLFSGFVRMDAGVRGDGADAVARPLSGIHLELAAAIMVARAGKKDIGSTDGMQTTEETSPYYAAWLEQVDRDLEAAEAALGSGDLLKLAELVEGSCLSMHASAMAARPGILYFRAPTLWAIERVRAMRRAGAPVMFTIDAGPHVVALAPPSEIAWVAAELGEHPEVERVIVSGAGEGAHLVDHWPELPA